MPVNAAGIYAAHAGCSALRRRVRTTDSVPPQVTALTATFTPPMSLRLSFSASKAGSLLLAPRRASQLPPTAQEVLDAVAARSTSAAAANFTATVPVTASMPTSHTLCVADGDQLVVYAVARDTEGQWPGRQDNVSPLQRCAARACSCPRQARARTNQKCSRSRDQRSSLHAPLHHTALAACLWCWRPWQAMSSAPHWPTCSPAWLLQQHQMACLACHR